MPLMGSPIDWTWLRKKICVLETVSTEAFKTEMQRENKNAKERNIWELWDNFLNGIYVQWVSEWKEVVWSNYGWEFWKINDRHQSTDHEGQRSPSRLNTRKNLHLGISYSDCRKSKAKRKSWKKPERKKILSVEEQG